MTTDAGAAPPPAAGAEGEKTDHERIGAIEAEQQRQGGVLDKIVGMLGGAGPKAGTSQGSGTESGSPPASLSVAEQVRQGVAEIRAREKQEADDKAAQDEDSAWRKSVDDRLAERRPDAPLTGRKSRFQRALFGRQDER